MIKTKPISFCNNIVDNLMETKDKQFLIDKLYNSYQISITDKDYIIMKDNYFSTLKNHLHYVTLMSNGNKYFLYLTKFNDIPLCLFIDRKIKDGYNQPRILSAKYDFSSELYDKDTLFGGELIKTNHNKWKFVIYNLYLYKGENKSSINIIDNYNLIYQILGQQFKYHNNSPCKIFVKKVYVRNEVPELLNNLIPNQLGYSVKGLVFHPENLKYAKNLYLLPNREESLNTFIGSQTTPKDIISDQSLISNNLIKEITPTSNSSKLNNLNSTLEESFISNKISKTNLINSQEELEDNNFININKQNNTVNNLKQQEYQEILDQLLEKYHQNNQTLWLNCKIIKDTTPDTYNLYIKYQNQLCLLGLAYIPNMATSKFLNKLFLSSCDNYIICCSYNPNFQKWKPDVKISLDQLQLLSISSLESL